MSTALQCPDCGQKHPLGAVGDQVVFPCSRCSRPLKVPASYRPGANGSGNGTAPRNGSAPAKGRTSAKRRGSGSMSLPVKILLWVVAFTLGAVVVRMIAKWTGFVGGNTLVDLLIDHSFGNYFRLFVLVPFWALFSTLFLTLFLEGPEWIRRRRAGTASGTASGGTAAAGRAAGAGAAGAKAGAKAGTKTAGAATRAGTTATIPKRVPAVAGAAAAGAAVGAATRPRAIPRRGDAPAEPVAPAPAPRPQPDDRTQALAVAPVAAVEPEPVDEYAERAAAGHRPRRIPRRDDGS